MLVIAGYVGVRLWRHRRAGVMTEAASIGLIAGAVLGGLAGAYVGAQLSHSVGGDLSDATGGSSAGPPRAVSLSGLHISSACMRPRWSPCRTLRPPQPCVGGGPALHARHGRGVCAGCPGATAVQNMTGVNCLFLAGPVRSD